MIKKIVQPVSGIVNKQVVEYKQINDFMTYFLKEQYSINPNDSYLNVYAEFDCHLFQACNLMHVDQLNQYDEQTALKQLIENFNKSLDNKTCYDLGMAQYLNKLDGYYQVQEFKRSNKEEARKERERLRKEKEQQEEIKWHLELSEAEQDVIEDIGIDSDMFLGLCDRHNIKLPIRTRGWVRKSLDEIKGGRYSYSGNPSKVVLDYFAELVKAIEENQSKAV